MTKETINESKGENNYAYIRGKLEKKFEFSHKYLGENFYKNRVIVERISTTVDYIPIIVPIEFMDKLKNQEGQMVEIEGQIRSFRKVGDDGKRHLEIFLFVKSIHECECDYDCETNNIVYIEGRVCNATIFKEKRFSGKKVTEMLIAVNRQFNKSDYIHCVAWGTNAYFAKNLRIGDRIAILGRMQSRKYLKGYYLDSVEREYRYAYELSVGSIEKVK